MKMLKALKALLRPKKDRTPEDDPGMNYLVAGLGNIGAEYASTRHNSGFMVLDAWAQASNVSFRTERYGDMAEVSFKGSLAGACTSSLVSLLYLSICIYDECIKFFLDLCNKLFHFFKY